MKITQIPITVIRSLSSLDQRLHPARWDLRLLLDLCRTPMLFDADHALAMLRLGTGRADATFRAGQEEAIRHVVEGRNRLQGDAAAESGGAPGMAATRSGPWRWC